MSEYEYNHKEIIFKSNCSNVTEVLDGPAYRHFWIENINIRPLKTRDVLKAGTRLYFNIPDNINELYNQYKSNGRTITTRSGESQNTRVGTEEINTISQNKYIFLWNYTSDHNRDI